jgi:hypothetical protein
LVRSVPRTWPKWIERRAGRRASGWRSWSVVVAGAVSLCVGACASDPGSTETASGGTAGSLPRDDATGVGGLTGGRGSAGYCALLLAPEPCQQDEGGYYFDVATGRCEYSVYAGCHGNPNHFLSLSDCRQVCSASRDPLCELPADPGSCDDTLALFFFNAQTERCEPFTYGGCEGNDNRFAMAIDCFTACGDARTLCPMHQPRGACDVPGTYCSYDAYSGCRCLEPPGASNECSVAPDCSSDTAAAVPASVVVCDCDADTWWCSDA